MSRIKNLCQTSYVKTINKYNKEIPENTLHCTSNSERVDVYQFLCGELFAYTDSMYLW